MAGYDGWSMSNNARSAYEDGTVPLTAVNKSWLSSNEIPLTVDHAKWLLKNKVSPAEWHHTSKVYNKTDFYNPEHVRDYIEAHGTHEDEYADSKRATVSAPVPATASWTEWHGTGRRARKSQVSDVPGHIIGDWFHHAGGKKKIGGNHITVTENPDPRKGTQFK
jgi:hypothetical protein